MRPGITNIWEVLFCRALTDRSWSWDTHGSTCYKSRLRRKNKTHSCVQRSVPFLWIFPLLLVWFTPLEAPGLINLVKEQHLVSNWNWIVIPEWPKHHHFYPPHGHRRNPSIIHMYTYIQYINIFNIYKYIFQMNLNKTLSEIPWVLYHTPWKHGVCSTTRGFNLKLVY